MLKSNEDQPSNSIRSKKKSKSNNNDEQEEDAVIAKTLDDEAKVKKFKNPPKMDPPELVQRSGAYSIVEDLMHTKANITYGQLVANSTIHKAL
jgi:hypothetical protein